VTAVPGSVEIARGGREKPDDRFRFFLKARALGRRYNRGTLPNGERFDAQRLPSGSGIAADHHRDDEERR